MYHTLLFLHSLFRWLVLASLLYGIFRAAKGYRLKLPFTRVDNALRHWTATIAHFQLMIGIVLYSQSPVVKYLFARSGEASGSKEPLFFGLIHIVMMLLAVLLITTGSAMAKRKPNDQQKFGTMLSWFALALLLIFLAVPWPFSPLANRPYIRAL